MLAMNHCTNTFEVCLLFSALRSVTGAIRGGRPCGQCLRDQRDCDGCSVPLQRQRSKLRTLAHSHTHDLAASAPLLAHANADRESEIKDFLLQLEQPVELGSACAQDHCKTLVDVQIWAEDIMSRWGVGAG